MTRWPSRMHGQLLSKIGWGGQHFSVGFIKVIWGYLKGLRVTGRGSRAPALILSWDPSLKSSLGVLLMPGQVEVLKFSVLIRMKVDKNNWCMQLLYSTLVMGSLHLGGCALLPSLREGLMIFLSTVTQT